MPRAALPQNYILNTGTLFENFETIGDWSKGGTDTIGTVTSDTTNVQLGSAAVRLTVNTATSNVAASKTVNQLFTDSTLFHLWLFNPYSDPGTIVDQLQIILSTTTNYAKYFQITFGFGLKPFVTGWNHLVFHASELTNTGSASWSDPILRLNFRVYARTGQTCYITLDNMFYAQTSLPTCVLTFDDTYDTVYTAAFAKMNPLGIRGTIYITKDLIESGTGVCGAALTKAYINTLYAAGWTVGNHTASHAHMDVLTQAQIEDELWECHEWLIANGWTRTAKHVAYPYGQPITAAMLAALTSFGAITQRTSYPVLQGVPAGNNYLLRSKQLGEDTTLATVQGWVDIAIRNQQTIMFYTHSIADGHSGDANYWGSTKFNGLIDYIVARKIKCLTIDEWYNGLTDPRFKAVLLSRS